MADSPAALYLKGLFGGSESETELRIDNDRNLPDKEEHTVWAMFDSSRFRHNSFIRVYGRVTLARGPVTTQRKSDAIRVINWNKAALLARHEFEFHEEEGRATLVVAENHLRSMGHNTSRRHRGNNWTPEALTDAISDATVLHVATHGNAIPLITDDGDQSHPPIHHRAARPIFAFWKVGLPTTGDFIKPHRTESIGAGSYPNNTGYPPVNISFFMACSASGVSSDNPHDPSEGVVNDFAEATLVTSSDGSVDSRYRAHVGWRIDVQLRHYGAASSVFWEALSHGHSAHIARDRMFEEYDRRLSEDFAFSASHYTAVHGDHFARLRNVYLENYTISETWYRRL